MQPIERKNNQIDQIQFQFKHSIDLIVFSSVDSPQTRYDPGSKMLVLF